MKDAPHLVGHSKSRPFLMWIYRFNVHELCTSGTFSPLLRLAVCLSLFGKYVQGKPGDAVHCHLSYPWLPQLHPLGLFRAQFPTITLVQPGGAGNSVPLFRRESAFNLGYEVYSGNANFMFR
jgi:hypothetical protein